MFSNFPTFKLEHTYYRVDQQNRSITDTRYFSREYQGRHRVLVAFVQLCRSTRRKFLPWLWEHVESLCVHSPSSEGQECRRLAKTVFRRQSRVLIATPSLAVYVKCVAVYLIAPQFVAQSCSKNALRAYTPPEHSRTGETATSFTESRHPRGADRRSRTKNRTLLQTHTAATNPHAGHRRTSPLPHEVLHQCEEGHNPPTRVRRHVSRLHPFRRGLSGISRVMSPCA